MTSPPPQLGSSRIQAHGNLARPMDDRPRGNINLISGLFRVHPLVKNGKRGACQQKAATVLTNRTAAA